MINEFTPVLILLTGALLILGGAKLARRFGLPDTFGCGVTLCIIALGIWLLPATARDWSAGGAGGDRLLTSVRIVGLTGMLFLAGTRFNAGQLRRKSALIFGLAITAGVLFASAVLLLKLLGRFDSGPIVLMAAALVGSSLWLPGEFLRLDKNDDDLAIDWQAGAAVFTGLAILAVYFYDVFAVITHARAASASAYTIVALYESLKLRLLFAAAYFICSRFLARAEGRISAARTTIGFVLIAVLIFALIAITTNQLGAIAWAFVAGALWRGTETGKKFIESERPLASATLISFVFLPLLLQSHGRRLTGFLALIITVLAAVLIKWLLAWVGMRVGGTSSRSAMRTAAAMVGPGEVGILLLGFGMTRWAIEPQVYFGILGCAFAASVFNSLVGRFAKKSVAPMKEMQKLRESGIVEGSWREPGVKGEGNEMKTKGLTCTLIIVACFTVLFVSQARAQEFTYKVEQDRMIGHRDGELIISDKGVEYRATKRENESRSWTYRDIKLLEILSPTSLRIWTYKDSKLWLGKDQSLTFKIIEGQMDQEVSDFLRERIARPFVTSFTDKGSELLAEIPVKRSRWFSGSEGILKVYPDRLVYESQTSTDSRSWRWTDIRGVGRPDRYKFDVETFEPQIGASSRSFSFILKEEMADKTYDLIWGRVYRPTPLIRAERMPVK